MPAVIHQSACYRKNFFRVREDKESLLFIIIQMHIQNIATMKWQDFKVKHQYNMRDKKLTSFSKTKNLL